MYSKNALKYCDVKKAMWNAMWHVIWNVEWNVMWNVECVICNV